MEYSVVLIIFLHVTQPLPHPVWVIAEDSFNMGSCFISHCSMKLGIIELWLLKLYSTNFFEGAIAENLAIEIHQSEFFEERGMKQLLLFNSEQAYIIFPLKHSLYDKL